MVPPSCRPRQPSCYLGHVAGLVHYGVQWSALEVPLGRQALAGALFGLFTYPT
ncbi:MAG: hypothetical protein ACOH1Y_13925 [Propionicimonas sp.]